ncbi:hypothetical protein [Halomonas sp. 3D7M]|uniref:hypothetical protein n=1 Tax=Halomonas sp. 3D7M TaxID=2742617 RepID=UPI001D032A90|nr:hypothetical protein [Halomonas sp. 3D7M]
MSHDYGVAAYIPPSRGFCTRAGYETYYDYTAKMEKQRYVCLEREQIPARYVPGQSCRDVNIGEGTFEKRPLGCTRTAYYVKMYNEDGTELQIDGSSDDGFYYIRPWDH